MDVSAAVPVKGMGVPAPCVMAWRDEPSKEAQVSADRFAALIEKIAGQRDAAAFAELFRHFAPRVKSYCLRGGADPATAEEIAQEAMVAVWRRAASFDPAKASVSTWIFTIARNRRIDMLRRERRPDPVFHDETAEVDDAPTPMEAYELSEARSHVRGRLEELPEDQATVLRMAFMDDKPHGRIADELNLPLGTVKSRIRLGLSRLKTMVTREEYI